MRLENKVAVVTGGATGIGEAVAKLFAKEGARVIVAGLPDDPVMEVVQEINNAAKENVAVGYQGDLGNKANAQACIKTATDAFGKLDILINNAAIMPEFAEAQEYTDEYFENIYNDNIRSTYHVCGAAIPHLKESRGSIVCTGSEAGLDGLGMNAPYAASKAWIHGWTKSIAQELGKHGVRANVVAPGPIDTQMTRSEHGAVPKQMEPMMEKANLFGRRGNPAEVASVFLFLASDESSYVTGSIYRVDGGMSVAAGTPGEDADKKASTQPKNDLNLQHSHEGFHK